MDEEAKLEYLKKPNFPAMLFALIFGPLVGMILAIGLMSVITQSYESVALLVGVIFVYPVCALLMPTILRYQKTKKDFISSCTMLGCLVGLVLGVGVFSLYTGLFGAACAFFTALFYKLIIHLRWKLIS